MRIDTFTKKDRVYLTPKSYLNKVKKGCIMLSTASFLIAATIFAFLGLTYISLIASGLLVLATFFSCTYFMKNSRTASLKGDSLILESFGKKHQVAPLGSIREVKSKDFLGVEFTKVRYKLDGSSTSFVIMSKSIRKKSPSKLLKEEIRIAKERKKEANHKPGSVITQTA